MMRIDFSTIDVATLIAAIVAVISAIYTTNATKKDNLKKDMLGNLTAERIEDLHCIKKWSNVVLSEATVALSMIECDELDKVNAIVNACNELWFVFKPVYVRDCEVLHSLKELEDGLISFYLCDDSSQRELHLEMIKEKRDCFRRTVFLYVQSSWTCIKNQILKGEQSSYVEFESVYKQNIKKIDEILKDDKYKEFSDVWKF